MKKSERKERRGRGGKEDENEKEKEKADEEYLMKQRRQWERCLPLCLCSCQLCEHWILEFRVPRGKVSTRRERADSKKR